MKSELVIAIWNPFVYLIYACQSDKGLKGIILMGLLKMHELDVLENMTSASIHNIVVTDL